MGSRIPHMKGGNFEDEKGPDQDMSGGHSSRAQHQCGANADWCVPDRVHIGANWRVRVNCPCAAAMRSHIKLL